MNNLPDDDAWPPDDPTDEELEPLTRALELEGEPDDCLDKAEEIPFADLDAEELPPEMLKP